MKTSKKTAARAQKAAPSPVATVAAATATAVRKAAAEAADSVAQAPIASTAPASDDVLRVGSGTHHVRLDVRFESATIELDDRDASDTWTIVDFYGAEGGPVGSCQLAGNAVEMLGDLGIVHDNIRRTPTIAPPEAAAPPALEFVLISGERGCLDLATWRARVEESIARYGRVDVVSVYEDVLDEEAAEERMGGLESAPRGDLWGWLSRLTRTAQYRPLTASELAQHHALAVTLWAGMTDYRESLARLISDALAPIASPCLWQSVRAAWQALCCDDQAYLTRAMGGALSAGDTSDGVARFVDWFACTDAQREAHVAGLERELVEAHRT